MAGQPITDHLEAKLPRLHVEPAIPFSALDDSRLFADRYVEQVKEDPAQADSPRWRGERRFDFYRSLMAGPPALRTPSTHPRCGLHWLMFLNMPPDQRALYTTRGEMKRPRAKRPTHPDGYRLACEACGVEFVAQRRTRLTCSDRCRTELRRTRLRDAGLSR